MFRCPNDPAQTEFVVYPYLTGVFEDEDSGIGVLVDEEGQPSNRWSDGTAGVPEIIQDLAREETDAWCPVCGLSIEWDVMLTVNAMRVAGDSL